MNKAFCLNLSFVLLLEIILLRNFSILFFNITQEICILNSKIMELDEFNTVCCRLFLFMNGSKFFVFRKTFAQSLVFPSKLVSTIKVKKRKKCNYK